MTKGLVIGKFYPPHLGHDLLIRTALDRCDYLDLLVCDSPAYGIDINTRVGWLRELYPKAHVRAIPDLGHDDDSLLWAKYTKAFLGYTPDVVFTSEDYGTPYAHFLGAEHVLVDKARKTVPIAARYIRKDVLDHWQFMIPLIRQRFAKRICVMGAESTGTTTLSKALAEHYKAPWVPEYGRYYTEAKLQTGNPVPWTSQEFTHIAQMQQAWEDQLAGESNGLLICDTNAFATRIWHERYMGKVPNKTLDTLADNCHVDGYILTVPDIPFVQDGIRDGEHLRLNMHMQFLEVLAAGTVPYISVDGSVASRLQQATKFIETINKEKVTIS